MLIAPDSNTSSHKISTYIDSNTTTLFGPRKPQSIKVFLACLAGAADPSSRNDIQLMQRFAQSGIPQENLWMFLEHQVERKSIKASLKSACHTCAPDDFLFIYVGGNGLSDSNYSKKGYGLYCVNGKPIRGRDVLKSISKCLGEVFLIVDSGFSGQMIEDAKTFFAKRSFQGKKLSILTSTQANNTACTGWKLVQLLIDQLFSGSICSAKEVGLFVVENLKTSLENQIAQFYEE